MPLLVPCVVHITRHHISCVEHEVRMEVEPCLRTVENSRIGADGRLADIVVFSHDGVLRFHREEGLTGTEEHGRGHEYCKKYLFHLSSSLLKSYVHTQSYGHRGRITSPVYVLEQRTLVVGTDFRVISGIFGECVEVLCVEIDP